ncbi:MAG TPA: 5-dehydro-2-deoxygluconokinase [Steroidobacteraceae bacterium]|nr:5-dehydro-2-deoxygluconokinase [Steroidobacteraceae bacterium]
MLTSVPELDLIAIGRVSVDLYGQQIGGRLEDAATFAKAVGGCPANVAIGAARLGLKTALLTRVGDEPMGRFVREQLAREGVDVRAVHVDAQRLTSLVLLSVRDPQTFPLIFYRENCADGALCADDVDADFIAAARAILVTGTHFSIPAAAQAQRKAIEAARAHGRQVILDVDYRPNLWGIGGHDAGDSRYARSARVTQALASVLPECTVIVGTEEELHIAAGIEDTLEAIRRIRAVSSAVIVCKRGAQGCVVFEGAIPSALEGGLVARGREVEIYNVLGAGDAFMSGFLRGYLRDEPLAVSARLANACGALAVSRLLCSSEFPTFAELEHFLTHGSAHRALRKDARLNHLHWATTRRRGPATLLALSLPGTVPAERLARLQQLAVDAVARVASERAGFGVVLDGSDGAAGWRRVEHGNLWVARSVRHERSRRLEFDTSASLATALTEWPSDVTVKCRCQFQADEERDLRRLAAACRAQGRELLLEIVIGRPQARQADAAAQILAHIYALDIRPDWWQLEPQADADAWARCANVIAQQDEYCRGMLVSVAPGQAPALALAAATPAVHGFVAGGSMFAAAAAAWLAGQLTDEAASEEIAASFAALVEVWSTARDSRLDRLQRSAN